MLDEKDLQAIAQLMDQKISASEPNFTGTSGSLNLFFIAKLFNVLNHAAE